MTPLACLVVAMGCAELVGLDGDYYEEETGGRAGTSGASGTSGRGGGGSDSGGAPNGGTEGGSDNGGSAGAGDTGGTGGDGAGGTEPTGGRGGVSGSSGAGQGGTETGGMGGAGAGGDGGGGAVGPPSCEGGLTTCGEDGERDCCLSEIVPEGEFDRGNDETYPASVSAFRLDIYEVTVARFRKFVADFGAGYRPEAGDGANLSNQADTGWDVAWNDELPPNGTALENELDCEAPFPTWTHAEGANETRPINCVSWYVSQAFCIWDGGRLPTEAEWNYAAAGGDEQRVFPWSEPATAVTIDERNASYWVDNFVQCRGDHVNGCTVADLAPVGSHPAGDGLFGHADLAGNVHEWVQDGFGTYPPACSDCANLAAGPDRTIRGGCYTVISELLRTSFRLNWAPDNPASGIGIRCARTP